MNSEWIPGEHAGPQCGSNLPRYRCHKQVWALRIAEIRQEHGNPGYVLVPADQRYARFCVEASYVAKHKPEPGGYYVVYEDGYQSFSPAQSFESGYTRIAE